MDVLGVAARDQSRMDPRLNYLGAAMFWLYIVAALVFSGMVIYTIISLPAPENSRRPQHSTDSILFSTLACISFTTLSYNMLNVLIQSYKTWNGKRVVLEEVRLDDIWRWSIESTLFHEFGKAIVASGAREIWTQAALIATMSVCLFMGAEGHRLHVPRLWAFFCLAQILPISFTQNLFYLAVLRLPQTSERVAAPKRPIFVMLLVYSASLVVAGHSDLLLLPTILTARLALFAPLLLCETPASSDVIQSNVLGGWQMQEVLAANALHIGAWWLYIFSRDKLSLQKILQSLFEHPAVSSLWCDFIICILSFAAWTWRSRGRAEPSGRADTRIKSSS